MMKKDYEQMTDKTPPASKEYDTSGMLPDEALVVKEGEFFLLIFVDNNNKVMLNVQFMEKPLLRLIDNIFELIPDKDRKSEGRREALEESFSIEEEKIKRKTLQTIMPMLKGIVWAYVLNQQDRDDFLKRFICF